MNICILIFGGTCFKSVKNTHNRIFFFFVFLEPHPWHMEVPTLEVKLDLQLPAFTTAMPDPSHLQPTPQITAMPDP